MPSIQELEKRYTQLYPSDGVDESVLKKVESMLKLKLPKILSDC